MRRLKSTILVLTVLYSLLVSGCGASGSGPLVLNGPDRAVRTDELNQQLKQIRQGKGSAFPSSHTIARVPKHKQINQLFCVIASAQMMLNYWELKPGRQLEMARAYSKANPDTPGRKRLAGLKDSDLKAADWKELKTNYVGLIRYLNRNLGTKGKVYNWEYATEGVPAHHLEALKTLVSRNIPVLVAARAPGIEGGHCMVMIGYTPTSVTVINPTHGKHQRFPKQEFMQRFQSLNCEWVTFVPEK